MFRTNKIGSNQGLKRPEETCLNLPIAELTICMLGVAQANRQSLWESPGFWGLGDFSTVSWPTVKRFD
jgi:hypothetical protein